MIWFILFGIFLVLGVIVGALTSDYWIDSLIIKDYTKEELIRRKKENDKEKKDSNE